MKLQCCFVLQSLPRTFYSIFEIMNLKLFFFLLLCKSELISLRSEKYQSGKLILLFEQSTFRSATYLKNEIYWCNLAACSFNVCWCLKLLLHIMHLNGFSPVCFRMCLRKSLLSLKTLKHSVHPYFFRFFE